MYSRALRGVSWGEVGVGRGGVYGVVEDGVRNLVECRTYALIVLLVWKALFNRQHMCDSADGFGG